MRKISQVATWLLLMSPFASWSQGKVSLSGTISDKSTGEVLIGAAVIFQGEHGVGATTNAYGFYSITVPRGNYTILSSYIGYVADTIHISLKDNELRNMSLTPMTNQLEEVTVTSTEDNDIIAAPSGVQKLSMAEIKNVPVLFGEKDILKTIQLLPGIKSAGDGKTGFYVRGGGSDQNLILLDEATVYNASHLLGFFSVFNSDAIKDVTLYKGGMPANYGGRLSSVVDIKMKEGNNRNLEVSGGLGLISSRLNIEGPLIKNKGSFAINARRTYVDLFTKLVSDTSIKNSKLNFYDLNAKANLILNDHNRIFLSGYSGADLMGLPGRFGLNWGNQTATFRWNHLFNNKLFSNTSLIYSNFFYNISINSTPNTISITSKITDYHIKQDFNYYISTSNKLDFGVDLNSHVFSPGAATVSKSSSYNPVSLQKKYGIETAAYISNALDVSEKWKVVYGVRVTAFSAMGPGNFYSYDPNGNISNETAYASGKVVKTYINPEPRLDLSYLLNDNSSLKLSYTRNVQNVHLLGNSTNSAPNSLYIPSSNNVKPEIADQLASGYYRKWEDGQYEFSSEIYYKGLQNQIDYKNGATLLGNENVESELLYGKGRAYGWETFFKKRSGKLTGWISYTLSRTEKQITGINKGNYYPATQDQTHTIAIVGIYNVNPRWTLSSTWVYNTGNAVSWPSGKFSADGVPVYLYASRNNYRMPAYNRLDLGATLLMKKTRTSESSWTFSIYNAYNRANAYTISFQQDPQDANKTQAVKTTLFKIVPSVTYNFKF